MFVVVRFIARPVHNVYHSEFCSLAPLFIAERLSSHPIAPAGQYVSNED